MRSGDKLFLRQYQKSSHGGIQVAFTDDTNTNWNANDQDGQQINNDGTQQSWHYRRIDLSSFAGKTISQIYLNQETSTTANPWSIYYNDISIVSLDGSVRPLYNRETTVSLTHSGTSSGTASVNHLSNVSQIPDETTTFYHGDDLGSSRIMSSVNGYPVWQATYLPFGYEYNPQITVNHYKFTGKERDSESGNDYFGARYYASTMGRFMSPDWSAKEEPVPYAKLDNPQSLNLYGYVGNNPLSKADADGHDAYWVVDKQTGQATLVIPVHYTGSGATPANVSAIVNQDNSLDTGGSPVKIQVISTDKPINGVLNTLDLSPGADMTHYPVAGEGVNALGGDHGHINTDNGQANGAAAHDTLHFAGIKDQYKEGPKNPDGSRGPSIPNPGTQDNIMSSRTGTKLTPNQIQEAQKNKTTKQCTSDNGKTTCN